MGSLKTKPYLGASEAARSEEKPMNTIEPTRFPSGFLLGAATAAHQIEGNNVNSDAWVAEHLPHSMYVEPSGDACDSYQRYEEDIELLAAAGLNAYRFSIEWARIEPEEGVWDDEALAHYRNVITSCHAHGVEPIVTLHHFTSPAWLMRRGGWEAPEVVGYFEHYVRHVLSALGHELSYICTINEANMGIQVARLEERYRGLMAAAAAAQHKDEAAGSVEGQVQMGLNLAGMLERQKLVAAENLEAFGTEKPAFFTSGRSLASDKLVMEAHRVAVAAVRELAPQARVGLTLSFHDIQALPGGEERAAAEWDEEFRHYLPAIEGDDFLGVQNYARTVIGPEGPVQMDPATMELTQGGYEYYPEALEHVIRAVATDFAGDIFVTENGYAGEDDTRRVDFLAEALAGVQRCLDDGLPVVGYTCWSLLDNFEWQKGFGPKFGLVAVDRATQKRTPKPSLAFLGSHTPACDQE